ncbi:MAG: hypothetical protein V8S96_07775 [Lachnospiraceae bacterium]
MEQPPSRSWHRRWAFPCRRALQRVPELIEEGIVTESGHESTGGRKAKVLSIESRARFALGLDITRNHVSFVLLHEAGNRLLQKKRIRCAFAKKAAYYQNLGSLLELFSESAARSAEKRSGRLAFLFRGSVDEEHQIFFSPQLIKAGRV